MITVIVEVGGMGCRRCAEKVKGALLGIRGVKGVEIDLEKGEAKVNSETALDKREIKAAIEAVDYEYRGIKD